MLDRARPMLVVENLEASYGESRVLHGASFAVAESEVVTLLGRNGAGKTTTLRSIMGVLRPVRGSIIFKQTEIGALPSNRIARLGIGYCPEERGIFASLNVQENLELPPTLDRDRTWTNERIYAHFPALKARSRSQGTKLSGGEQQMLAIARVLRAGAPLLLLDEPTEGLAPALVKQIGEIIRLLARSGMTVLLVEQNFHFASSVADRHYVLERGKVVDAFTNIEVKQNPRKLETYLAV
jgi:branched-chain amino acid transport system ATP-binding protein